jgi:hypothetical protein
VVKAVIHPCWPSFYGSCRNVIDKPQGDGQVATPGFEYVIQFSKFARTVYTTLGSQHPLHTSDLTISIYRRTHLRGVRKAGP